MNIGIPDAILICTLVNLTITKARLTSRRTPYKFSYMFMLGFPPYEYGYSCVNTDMYACEPLYYQGKTHIKAENILFFPTCVC